MTFSKPDPRSVLLPYQHKLRNMVLRDASRFTFALWARQTGKDFTASAVMVEDCLRKPGVNWNIVAPSERQSTETLEKCRMFSRGWGCMLKMKVVKTQNATEMRFTNGSRIMALPGKPETVRGLSGNVLFTEFAFFENPDKVWRAAYPSITNPLSGGVKKVLVITTPAGKACKPYSLWCSTDVGSDMEGVPRDPASLWRGYKLSIHEAVRMGLKLDAQELKQQLDDEDAFAQEYMCEFMDASSVLVPYELIEACSSFEASEILDPAEENFFAGVDFGRVNDPTVVWILKRIDTTLWTSGVLVLRNMNSMDQAQILEPIIRRSNKTCFDYTGPGTGLGDMLFSRISDTQLELCTFTQKLKTDIFTRLRRAFESRELRIPISPEIKEDIHAVTQLVKNGNFFYSAPRSMAGHSDRCTALALALRAAGDGDSAPMEFGMPNMTRMSRCNV